MHKTLSFTFILFVLLVAPSLASGGAISQELDAYARANGLAPANISAAGITPTPEKKVVKKEHEFEFGIERYDYRYKETVQGSTFMHNDGVYNGFLLAYTFRPLDVDALFDIIDNVFRLEARYASGEVDYTGSGTFNGLEDYMWELRGIAGHEFRINPALRVIPFVGLGFRYLNNGAEAMPAQMIGGDEYLSGYNRESKYYYVPVGVEVYRQLSGGWGLGADLEYDFWISGEQTSHLEDMQDMSGTNAGYDPLVNRQHKGFGMRGSLKIDRTVKSMKFRFEPYYRYWKVDDSETNFLTRGGEMVPGSEPGTYQAGLEPENTTQEIGLRMGLLF